LVDFCGEAITDIPHKPSYHFHWLLLKGEQPIIPENTQDNGQPLSSIPAVPPKGSDSKQKIQHLGYKVDEITKELMAFYELFTGSITEQLKLLHKARYLSDNLFSNQFKPRNIINKINSIMYFKNRTKYKINSSTYVKLFIMVIKRS